MDIKMINNQWLKGGFKTSALLILARADWLPNGEYGNSGGSMDLLNAPIMGYRRDESAQRVLRLTSAIAHRRPIPKAMATFLSLDSVIETQLIAN